jgi:hypothetical protein
MKLRKRLPDRSEEQHRLWFEKVNDGLREYYVVGQSNMLNHFATCFECSFDLTGIYDRVGSRWLQHVHPVMGCDTTKDACKRAAGGLGAFHVPKGCRKRRRKVVVIRT